MTNNQEQMWRLEDEEGNQLGEAPASEHRFVFDYGEYTERRGRERRERESRSRPSDMDIGVPDRFRARMSFPEEYSGTWGTNDTTDAMRYSERNRDIEEEILDEVQKYRALIGRQPEYISLNRTAYAALRGESGAFRDRAGAIESLVGIRVMCNPTQQLPIMVLGTGIREAFREGLYR